MFGRKALAVKNADQIRKMRVAGLVVGEALELIADQATAGTTTGDLDRAAEAFIRSNGATPSFLGYHGFTGSLCVSVNEEVVHGIPGSRPLCQGDLVSIDCGAIVDSCTRLTEWARWTTLPSAFRQPSRPCRADGPHPCVRP